MAEPASPPPSELEFTPSDKSNMLAKDVEELWYSVDHFS